MDVRHIMTPRVVRISPDDTLAFAADLFQRHRFHHLLVVDNDQLVGVVSDRDLLKNVSPFINKMAERPQDVHTLHKRVHQVMSRQLVIAYADEPIEVAAKRMLLANVSCLPVIDIERHPIGIITWRDLLRAMCAPDVAVTHGGADAA